MTKFGLAQVKVEGNYVVYDMPSVLDLNKINHVVIKLHLMINKKRDTTRGGVALENI